MVIIPEGGTTRSNSIAPPAHDGGTDGGTGSGTSGSCSSSGRGSSRASGIGVGAIVGGSHSSTSSRCSAGDRGEPFGRCDRHLVIERLMRPLGVVVDHPRIDRRLRLLDAGERLGLVQEVRPEGPVEEFHLSVLVRGGRRGEPMPDPVAAADLVEHLPVAGPVLAEGSVNCFPLSVSTSSGTPNL